MDALSIHSEGFSSCSKYIDGGPADEDGFGQERGGLDDVFVAVEYNERVPRAKCRDDFYRWILRARPRADRQRDGGQYQQRIFDYAQIHKLDAVLETRMKLAKDSKGDGRLSDSPGTNDRAAA